MAVHLWHNVPPDPMPHRQESVIHESLEQLLSLAEAATMHEHHAVAAQHFARAVTLAPRDVTLVLALANAHQMAGDHEQRIDALRSAFELGDRSDINTEHALGTALLDAGEAALSVRCFESVKQQRANDPAALAGLAAALRANGEPARAWPLVKRAIESAPHTAAHLLTAAQVRHDMGDLAGALSWLDKAELERPGHAPTQFQRALSTLLAGAGAAGWEAFERRPLPVPNTSAVPWSGDDLNGRSVLVTAEQGIGDQLQFLRFVSRLPDRGAGRVVVEAHAGLLDLLIANGYDVTVRGQPPVTDVHVPLLSLPHKLGLHAHVDGERVPYLRAVTNDDKHVPSATPRIGVVWAGNPAFPGRTTRDLNIALLPQLVAIPSIQWVSLQQGRAGDVTIDGLHTRPAIEDWSTTAAILAELDGLVTTDTGIAHLAGAMGVRTWVLLQKVPDWRWGLTGATTPWYPSLTLLRQPRDRDWRSVIDALADSLSRTEF